MRLMNQKEKRLQIDDTLPLEGVYMYTMNGMHVP